MIKYNTCYRQLNIEAEPLLTVIVAVYNIQPYIKRCVDSILSQTYYNLEIILVDDGSTDECAAICDAYATSDERIITIHKQNGGLSDARNVGMDRATGEYITFVDGDDWIDSDMYSTMLQAMLCNNADLSICRYYHVYSQETLDASTGAMILFEGQEALECLIREDDDITIQNAAWNKVYKRSLTEQYGKEGILRFPKGKWYEDIVYTTKLLERAKKSVYLDKAFYHYVIDREGSIMSKGINPRILTDQIPTYYEKTQFLHDIGREDLANIHAYFFYKRMLIYYTEFVRSHDKHRKEYCKKLKQLIYNDRNLLSAAFGVKIANPNEKKKMDIFLCSPVLYRIVMRLNDSIIIPIKVRINNKKKTILIIQLSGGLGNQMFQYALYKKLLTLGKKVKIDDRTEYGREDDRPIQLDKLGVQYKRASREEITEITDSYMDIFSRCRRKITGRRTKKYVEQYKSFDENVFHLSNAYLIGCWQSEKYFQDIRDTLLKEFDFSRIQLETQDLTRLEEIENNIHAVSMHIRRGDYLNAEEVYGGICTEEYYNNAIAKMKKQDPQSHFYIFSNDSAWTKEHYIGEEYTIMDGHDEDKGYIDMYLMSRCHHNIIANSSFSWWAAWLNQNQDKCIIAPSKWLNNCDCEDIYCPQMLRI